MVWLPMQCTYVSLNRPRTLLPNRSVCLTSRQRIALAIRVQRLSQTNPSIRQIHHPSTPTPCCSTSISVFAVSSLRSIYRSFGDLVGLDGRQQLLGMRVILEVPPDGLEHLVDVTGQIWLDVTGVQTATQVVFGALSERRIGDGPAVLVAAVDAKLAVHGEDHVLNVRHARVALQHLGWAEGLFDLSVDVGRQVLHEDGRVGIRLGHLLLALQQPWQHAV
mmetsp:Transcript_44461/g.110683  ORF Transcript_44461/g.110683 Transcript_44461/m.110683 type:complete len:220 (-) Transcript_44461:558-1217(-)